MILSERKKPIGMDSYGHGKLPANVHIPGISSGTSVFVIVKSAFVIANSTHGMTNVLMLLIGSCLILTTFLRN